MRFFLSACLAAALAAPAMAITLDGSIVGDAYNLRSVQTIQTGFGGGFNEIAAGYVNVDGSTLNLAITGKIESFNKALVFFDTIPGAGENTITPSVGNGGNNPANDNWADRLAGLTFDAGFTADYLIIPRAGNFGGDKFDFDFSTVGNTSVVETSFDIFGGSQTGVNPSVGASGIGVAYDNSLTGGSIGGSTGDPVAPGVAEAITSGLEFSIPLAALGNPNLGQTKISVVLSNGNLDFLANQTLGGLPVGFGNLAGPGSVNFESFGGLQYFQVPEPSSVALVLGALAAAGVCLRRK